MSEEFLQLMLCISQGSVVTHLRCGWKYVTSLVANLLLSTTVKEFSESANISQSYERIASDTFFFVAHGVFAAYLQRL